VRAFDERAAVEFGAAVQARGKKRQKETRKLVSQNKVRFDQQIVAIAKVQGAKIVYSDDAQLQSFARECGMEARGLADIDIPMKQLALPVDDQDPTQE